MNEKTQNQAVRWLKTAIEVGILLFAVGIAWATLRGTVQQNYRGLEKHDKRITAAETEVTDVKSDIREIRVEQKYISEGIREIKEKLK